MDNVKKNTESSDTTKYKRERSVNFTQGETELLLTLAEAKIHIIENKKSDAITWQEKEKAWKDIEKAFNRSSASVFRDHKHLKLKYEALKRDTRKKISVVRADGYKTDGSTGTAAPVLSPVEQKVKKIILQSVQGNEGTSTSDTVVTSLFAEEQNDQPATEPPSEDDASNNTKIEYIEVDCEPPKKKICKEEELECESDSESPTETQFELWRDWYPTSQKAEKHPVLSKTKDHPDILRDEKIEIAKIQKRILTEELEQKLIQRIILEKDLEHKDVIYQLEKQHLLLKIELLKKELGQK